MRKIVKAYSINNHCFSPSDWEDKLAEEEGVLMESDSMTEKADTEKNEKGEYNKYFKKKLKLEVKHKETWKRISFRESSKFTATPGHGTQDTEIGSLPLSQLCHASTQV